MEDEAQPRHFLRLVERALKVLDGLGATTRELTMSEVAEQTGLDRATARRILLTLVDMGYAAKDGKLFRLRPRVLRIGFGFLTSLGLGQRGQFVLETLTSETNHASSLCVLDENEIVYIGRSTMPGLASQATAVGTRYPAHVTSMGRVLLASASSAELDRYFQSVALERLTPKTVTNEPRLRKILTKVREQGYAYVAGELSLDIEAIAVPVNKPGVGVIAAMSLSTSGIGEEIVLAKYLPSLRNAAAVLSKG